MAAVSSQSLPQSSFFLISRFSSDAGVTDGTGSDITEAPTQIIEAKPGEMSPSKPLRKNQHLQHPLVYAFTDSAFKGNPAATVSSLSQVQGKEGSFLIELNFLVVPTSDTNLSDASFSMITKALNGATILDTKATASNNIIVVLSSLESVTELQPNMDDILKCSFDGIIFTAADIVESVLLEDETDDKGAKHGKKTNRTSREKESRMDTRGDVCMILVYEYMNSGNLEQWLHGDMGKLNTLTWEALHKLKKKSSFAPGHGHIWVIFGVLLLEAITGRDPVDYERPANEVA
ncbi:hypothetical protein HID58_060692 [Brassica napus]|uniref:non-specific serine/threonine protein kinase n=1 Tax=Brassica napus TaxID=3708 RepID=A0ABQ7ZWD9_BRANA|nr:hypothetical protein HID58_060692 [Brassica napus]